MIEQLLDLTNCVVHSKAICSIDPMLNAQLTKTTTAVLGAFVKE